MEKKKMKHVIIALIFLSAAIYVLQLLIFRDPKTTAFYIFQDFAFMPATIAIATLIVGELMNAQEKKERISKTRMLTSTFFTEVGTRLVRLLIDSASPREELLPFLTAPVSDDLSLKEQREMINSIDIRVFLTEECYQGIADLIKNARSALLVLSSNPMLFEHEDFTDLLWALFHIIDEYNLRGDFKDLSESDISHLNIDYAEVLRLLLINYLSNASYLSETYPNLYRTATEQLRDPETAGISEKI